MQVQLVWIDSDLDSYTDKVQIDLSGLAVGSYSVEYIPEHPDSYREERLIYTAQIVKEE